jgi:hypothetical protein
MHTMMTTDIARQLVSDRLREAEGRRLARSVRGRRGSVQAGESGPGFFERVVRRTPRRPAVGTSISLGAS